MEDEMAVSKFFDFFGVGVVAGGGLEADHTTFHPSLRGFVREYRRTKASPGWSPFGSWCLSMLCHLATLLSIFSTVANVLLFEFRAQLLSARARMLPLHGESCERAEDERSGKRSREFLDPTVFGTKRAKLDSSCEKSSGPQWTHDLTRDGDIEANPGPAGLHSADLDAYLTWITGAPPDRCWAADGASAFISVARWIADRANQGEYCEEILTEARSLCDLSTGARGRFAFLWETDPSHGHLHEAVAFFRWLLESCRHIQALGLCDFGSTTDLDLFLPLPMPPPGLQLLEVAMPAILTLGTKAISCRYGSDDQGLHLILRPVIADPANDPPMCVFLSVAQLRRCLSVLNEIAHRCDFVVLDFVLDLIDGQVLDEPNTGVVLEDLCARVRSWNCHQMGNSELRVVYLAVVPAMGFGFCVVAGNSARSSVNSEVFQSDMANLVACTRDWEGAQQLTLLFPWMFDRHLTELGLMLTPLALDSLAGGARDSAAEMAKHILPRGVKRKRQSVRRYYLQGVSLK
eukprot:6455433-Amphidinium_carterae.1